MPRTLPWLTNAKPTRKAPTASTAPKRKKSPTTSDDLVDSDLNPLTSTSPPHRPKLPYASRAPSSSPPPAPPPAEPMRPGDDAWMLVEDEFLATAQLYTTHLHHAAYTAAKRAAKARGESTIRGIQRGTDGKTKISIATKLAVERQGTLEKRGGVGEGASEEEAWAVNPQLAGLMSRRDTVAGGRGLVELGRGRSDTRASKGFLRSPEKARKWAEYGKKGAGRKEVEMDEESEDDLDRPPRVKMKSSEPARPAVRREDSSRKSVEPAKAQPAAVGGTFKLSRKPPKSIKQEPVSTIKTERPATMPKTSRDQLSTSIFDDFDIPSTGPNLVRPEDFLAKKRAQKERREKDERRKAGVVVKQEYDAVPTFTI